MCRVAECLSTPVSVSWHFVALADCIRSSYVGGQFVITRNMLSFFFISIMVPVFIIKMVTALYMVTTYLYGHYIPIYGHYISIHGHYISIYGHYISIIVSKTCLRRPLRGPSKFGLLPGGLLRQEKVI